MFNHKEDVDHFHSLLNDAHPNLQFTVEMASNILPFLDTAVSVQSSKFVTEVYRKPTNTGVLMHYHSNSPWQWKKALIKCLLTRAHRLSSSPSSFKSEVSLITDSLIKNSYPAHRIDKVIKEFYATSNINQDGSKRTQKEPDEMKSSREKQVFF